MPARDTRRHSGRHAASCGGDDGHREPVRRAPPRRLVREVFGDEVAAAIIDRLVHHAEVIALKGDSYRLEDRDLGRPRTAATDET